MREESFSASKYLRSNCHRLIYSAGIALGAYAAGVGNAVEYFGSQESLSLPWSTVGYASFVALMAFAKAYALPGKDLVVETDRNAAGKSMRTASDGMASSASSQSLLEVGTATDLEKGADRRLASMHAEQEPAERWYPAKYAYLIADHVVSFNNLCFLGNEVLRLWGANIQAPLWGLAVYGVYYAIIDAPFITAVDGHTAHEEIFAGTDAKDKAAYLLRGRRMQAVLRHAQEPGRVAGSLSHSLMEVLPLLTALNQLQHLPDMMQDQPVLFWSAVTLLTLSLVTVVAQTYLYEGREQKQAFGQFYAVDSGQQVVHRPSLLRHCLDHFLLRTMWLSVLAHAASEGLSWLLYPRAYAPSMLRYALSGVCVVNEFAGQLRSEYPEGIEATRESIEVYRQAKDQADESGYNPLSVN